MTLKEFLKNIDNLVKENPKVLDYEVIYAADDEGNGYQAVHFTPTTGEFKDGEFNDKVKKKNAIVIN